MHQFRTHFGGRERVLILYILLGFSLKTSSEFCCVHRVLKMEITKIVLISFSIAFASAGFSQYYITPQFVSHFSPAVPIAHQQPLTSQISQNSFIDFPSIYHAQPFYFSQNVNPFFQHAFSAPIPQVNVEQARSSNRETSGKLILNPTVKKKRKFKG
ncbi:uncharacterized protein LOC123310108 [Coccinella septempunctata]|uniref:uncharacterized protein LOC123310108 n=1 Tax=Coccinella septempunctata TaxID=41139 RepID=UPI001D069AFC|nr:uncharacterized protein LOC123310108 [Coccinella septempunctata]